jgi:hypothetical protein
LVATDLLLFVISTINFENPKIAPKLPQNLISGFAEFFVVLIHRFDVLGVDLHCHKFSSPNSLYFFRNHRFSIQISAQINELLKQHPEPAKAGLHTRNSRTEPKNPASKKSGLEKAGLRPAKAGAPAKAGPRSAKIGLSCSQHHINSFDIHLTPLTQNSGIILTQILTTFVSPFSPKFLGIDVCVQISVFACLVRAKYYRVYIIIAMKASAPRNLD